MSSVGGWAKGKVADALSDELDGTAEARKTAWRLFEGKQAAKRLAAKQRRLQRLQQVELPLAGTSGLFGSHRLVQSLRP